MLNGLDRLLQVLSVSVLSKFGVTGPLRSPSDTEKPVQNRVGIYNVSNMLNFFWL